MPVLRQRSPPAVHCRQSPPSVPEQDAALAAAGRSWQYSHSQQRAVRAGESQAGKSHKSFCWLCSFTAQASTQSLPLRRAPFDACAAPHRRGICSALSLGPHLVQLRASAQAKEGCTRAVAARVTSVDACVTGAGVAVHAARHPWAESHNTTHDLNTASLLREGNAALLARCVVIRRRDPLADAFAAERRGAAGAAGTHPAMQ
eukprot:353037-Chlamydomonas_euryale.AAC.12